jgi:quinol monooxygenase YgiN
MVYVNIRATVPDYTKWRTAFDSFATLRKDTGATGVNQIYRDVENPSTVTLIMEWNNIEKARSHLADPKTKEAMQNAGITGSPEVRFFNHA